VKAYRIGTNGETGTREEARLRRRHSSRGGRAGALAVIFAALAAACSAAPDGVAAGQERIDRQQLLDHVETLASRQMEGRRTGSEGHVRARDHIARAFEAQELEPIGGSFLHPFSFTAQGRDVRGWNIIGMVRGTELPDRYIVVTGHYDHLGIRNDQLFPGADDNASGAAAVIALGGWFRDHPPRHSIVFMTPDAEEFGLRGARDFVADPPVPLDAIVLNVNLDMISHNEAGELFAAGPFHYPSLGELVDRTRRAPGVTLLKGHDQPHPQPEDDWTMLSDHGAFHEAGIPFLYFGVEDHAHYHKPTDVFDIIHPDFYHGAVETILNFVLLADQELDAITAAGESAEPEPDAPEIEAEVPESATPSPAPAN
jgi:hypothetical protein